jgi:ATP-binding cassette subfamily C (CFTR/MRP) protein 1
MSSSSSSFDEKKKEVGLVDPQAAAQNSTEYEPIKTEPSAHDPEADPKRRQGLTRLESQTSAISDFSDSDGTSTKASIRKKKFYKRLNPLKWGGKPPIPKENCLPRTHCQPVQSTLVPMDATSDGHRLQATA